LASARRAVTMSAMSGIEGLPSRYRIESIIGEGGFGKVYRVFDSKLDRVLALKIMNLVRVYDFGNLESRLFYFTMEYLEGADLRSYCKNADNLKRIPSIIDQLLAALAYLHENGVIHGDIKPENISMTGQKSSPLVKLLDFGLISSIGARQGKNASGTPRFLAPEILYEGARKSHSTDLYALGATLSESIEDLDFPASIDLTDELLKRRYAGMSKTLSGAGVRNPSSVASFILDLCDTDPFQRPATAKVARGSFRTKVLSIDAEKEPTFNPVFVGRERELEEIAQFLRARQQVKKVLVLRGPRGVGKKSIIRKAVQTEQLKRRLIIDLSTISYTYFSVKELMWIVSEQLPGPEKEILAKTASAISLSSNHLNESTDSKTLSQRSLVHMNRIIDGLHEISYRRPLSLILPDIDRLGPDNVQFLIQIMNYLGLTDSSIKLILSLNTDVHLSQDAAKLFARFDISILASILDIEGFSEDMLTEYFTATFGEALLTINERKKMLRSTKGIPLVIETATRQLLSMGIIQFAENKWTFDRTLFARSDIPIECEATLDFALSNLDIDEKLLLELLAILNHDISLDHLNALVNNLIPSWKHALNILIGKTILAARANGTISLVHPKHRELILGQISESVGKHLNEHVARYLSNIDPPDAIRIAGHYIAAENIDNAAKYAYEVANGLYSTYMPYDCLQLFTDLSNLAIRFGNRLQLARTYALLGPIQHHAGLINEAIDTYTALITIEDNVHDKARCLLKIARLYEDLGDSRAAILWVRKAQHVIGGTQLRHLEAEAYLILGELSKTRRTYYLEQALSLFKDTDANMYLIALSRLCQRYKRAGIMTKLYPSADILASHISTADDNAKKVLYHGLASIHFLSGDYESQRQYLEKKIAIERKQDDMQGMLQSLNSLCGNYYTKGNYSALVIKLKDIYFLAIRYNQLLTAANASFNLILAYRTLGDYGQALATATGTTTLIRERNITEIGSISLIKPAQLYALLGKSLEREYLSNMAKLNSTAKNIGSAISLGHYNMCYSTYHHINLRHRKALAFADKALVFFKKAEDRDDVVLALVQKSILLAMLGELKKAARSVRQAAKIYDEIHCEYLKPFLMLGRGIFARCAGDEDARQLLAEGLRTSKKMGTRETTWQIQRELALHHRDRGEYRKALDYFQDAIETLKQITETLDEEELKVSYLEVPIRKRIFDEIKEMRRQTK